jgi:hypothetical protein
MFITVTKTTTAPDAMADTKCYGRALEGEIAQEQEERTTGC